jgi:2-dehydro-3-deoxygluconokinase
MEGMEDLLKKLSVFGIVPVVVLDDSKTAALAANALAEGGLPCAEIVFRTPAAEESIRIISKEYPQMLVGAGTVLTTQQADLAIEAGARFIVSPGLNPKVVEHCMARKIPIIPGCMTPGEIEAAIELGLNAVKFFPAEAAGGIKMVKALSAPFPDRRFMPTGGIDAGNLGSYLGFNKVFACGGSWMITRELINSGDFGGITRLTKEAASAARKARGEYQVSKRAIPFGELMLRLAPEGYLRFTQADKFGASYGGGEANVAVSLANYGISAAFVSKMPANDIGRAGVNSLRKHGVDTSLIVWGGERVGIYFLEKGASQRPSKVIYDRAGSSIAKASQSDFDWDSIFDGADWFHFTGITPALGGNVAEICLEACKTAKKKNVAVSCDLNYRSKLWSREEAGRVMAGLCKYVDVCIANEEDASDVFGIHAHGTDVVSGKVNHAGYEEVAKELMERFGFQKVAVTFRSSLSADDNSWAAMLYDGRDFHFSREYQIHIVDRVGGGDSFSGGLIYALLNEYSSKEAVEFAVAASCLKHSVEGDYNQVTVEEVKKLAGGDASGRVQR